MLDTFLNYSELNKKSYTTSVCWVNILKNIILPSQLICDTLANDVEKIKSNLLDKGIGEATINKYLALLSKAFI